MVLLDLASTYAIGSPLGSVAIERFGQHPWKPGSASLCGHHLSPKLCTKPPGLPCSPYTYIFASVDYPDLKPMILVRVIRTHKSHGKTRDFYLF